MAFITRVRANGATYLYLKEYAVRNNFMNNSVTIYRFGKIEKALKNMYKWKGDLNKFPEQLKHLGFQKSDLNNWINRVEKIKADVYASN